MNSRNILLLFFLFSISLLFSQSLVINEVSQGSSGNKEYVEFLVIPGAGPYNCSDYCLDLRGWIFDDNNGYFSGPGSGNGIAKGALRFAQSSFWSCIPIGTLIVIYNDVDKNPTLPTNDLNNSDNNFKLVIPVSSDLFEYQIEKPNPTSMSYPDQSTDWLSGGGSKWDPLGMSNSNDSFQTYAPSDNSKPAHGVSWGNNNINNIIYFSGEASDKVFYFSNNVSNNPNDQKNWTSASCLTNGTQTPGTPNNSKNGAYIKSLTDPLKAVLVSTSPSNVSSPSNSDCCNGSAIVNASGSVPGYTYEWYEKPTNTPINIPNDSQKAIGLCKGDYYCVIKSSINCIDTVLFSIAVDPTNQKSPTFDPIGPFCAGATISDLPKTSTNGITGSWSPIVIDNTQNKTYTFTPDANQCANSTALVIDINPIPIISIKEKPTICLGESTTLTTQVDLIGGSYLWTPTDKTDPEITINPSSTASYSVIYTLNGCKSNQADVVVTVNPSVSPEFDSKGPFCENAFLPQVLLPELSKNGISGTWNPAMLSTENPGITIYTFTPNPGQCSSVYPMSVEVYSSPTIDAGNDVIVCSGSQVKLIATGGLTYSWTGGIKNNVSFTPAKTEKYYVFGQDAKNCEAEDSVSVIVVEQPKADFSSDVVTGYAPLTVNFTNSSLNTTNNIWNFGDGKNINSLNLSGVSNVYSNPGSYTVWLYAKNSPCIDSTSKTIIVLEFPKVVIKIPNVFSPNADGSNDEWFITNENLTDLDVIILNRWGNEVSKIETLNGTWNGKTTDGSDAKEGVYFFKYQAKGIDSKDYNGQGFISLIR
jgi:gliding motility-associated-like protein